MTEFHVYSEKNISFCKTCQDIYNEFKGQEDREIDNYHKIVTLTQKVNNNKKRTYTATMSDFRKGANLQVNAEYKGNSQLGAFDVVVSDNEDQDEENENSSRKKQRNK